MIIRKDFSQSKNALNLGALTGLVISAIQLIAYSFGLQDSSIVQWLIYILIIMSFSWGVRAYRDLNNGYISYGESFGFGALLSLGASLVYAFFNYLYIKFLNPDYLTVVLDNMEMALYEAGYEDDMVKSLMEVYNTYFGPGMFAFALLFNIAVIGLIATLVISFFVRNTKPMFEE
jgi:hypothetical protein